MHATAKKLALPLAYRPARVVLIGGNPTFPSNPVIYPATAD
jgi:hypothetical protein